MLMDGAPLIVIDARLVTDAPSGIGVYTSRMLSLIPALAPDLRFHALFRTKELLGATLGDALPPNLSAEVVPYGPFSPKSQLLLPLLVRRLGASILHTPNFIMPYLMGCGRCKVVSNIHDIIPLAVADYAPNSRTSRLRAIYRMCIRLAISRSATVITGSQAAKDDIVRIFSLCDGKASRLRVIHDGADAPSSSASHTPVKDASDTTSERLVIYVGRMDPYKNVPMLVEAFDKVRRRLPFPVRLKVIGPKDPRYPEAETLARTLGAPVEFTGFVTDAELDEAYRTADLLAHPSKYEGFGLQLVEAMAAGTPALCTDGGSQPEVAGDAARITPSGDASAFAAAMEEILLSPAVQGELRAKGAERARLFTWDATARSTLAIYRGILADGGAR